MITNLKLLENITNNIRKRNISEAKKFFVLLIKKDATLTRKVINQIYDFGETFKIYKSPSFFLKEIDKKIKKPTKLLYLLKLEIMYNAYNNKEDKKRILEVCERALTEFEDYPEFLNQKSIILGDLGKKEEALYYINHAVELEPEIALFVRNKAMALYDLNRREEALETIEKARGMEPTNSLYEDDKNYIEYEEDLSGIEEEKAELKDTIKKIKSDIINAKIEFITIAGLFVAILAFIDKSLPFDYTSITGEGYAKVILYQISANAAWIFIVFIILIFILLFNICVSGKFKKKK